MMRRIIPVLLLIILFSSCRKSESDFLWNKSYGKGMAYFLSATADSGLISCGETDGKPYLVRLDKNRRQVFDYSGPDAGLFSAVWFDTSGYVTGGNAGGDMLLMHLSPDGTLLWEKTFDAGFRVDFTSLFYAGNGNLLAIGTASPDSSDSGTTGILFVRFDTTGQVMEENKINEVNFVAASGAHVDGEGNIILALTRQAPGARPKASVAMYNDLLQKLWETELYNNPDFGAASLSVIADGSGNIYLSGKTELPSEEGTLNNSFLASLSSSGTVRWKKYLESSNQGSALIFDDVGDIMMLNRNCFIINIANTDDGSDAGLIRMFSLCDSYNTDALGAGLALSYDGNIYVAGSHGGNFYLALKSSQ